MSKPEMLFFKVPKATAEFNGEGTKVTLWYPATDKREYLEGRRLQFEGQEEFGIKCFEKLLKGERVDIANETFPIRPSSGGAIDVFSDGSIISHRRDGLAPTHPLQFSIGGGFPSREAQFYNIQLLIAREASEETILFGKSGKIFVPNDIGQEVNVEMAKKIGLDVNPERLVTFPISYSKTADFLGPDTLDIRDENGDLVCRERGYVSFASDGSRNLNFLRPRYWGLSPEAVDPVDAEGMEKPDGSFSHYNRECFVFSPDEIKAMVYGKPFTPRRAYKLGTDKKPELQQKAPEGMPYIWYQDDMLDRMLRGLDILPHKYGYMNWLERQKEVELATLKAIQARDYVAFQSGKGFQPCEPTAKRAVPNVYKFLDV